jgi:hypothetical protein
LDSDSLVRPNQTAWFNSAASGAPLSGWDYDCSGAVEYYQTTATVGQCYASCPIPYSGDLHGCTRIGDIEYATPYSTANPALKYMGGSSWQCTSSNGCSGTFAACTPWTNAAPRH